jgi:hypothetical protein
LVHDLKLRRDVCFHPLELFAVVMCTHEPFYSSVPAYGDFSYHSCLTLLSYDYTRIIDFLQCICHKGSKPCGFLCIYGFEDLFGQLLLSSDRQVFLILTFACLVHVISGDDDSRIEVHCISFGYFIVFLVRLRGLGRADCFPCIRFPSVQPGQKMTLES